ncbi:flagellar export protein FliJ [Clostridium thermarum]|uniref:flagellar export protein FliJ n=1 Tax=Clostridium thermarum TaxID=1716543 RepID=UPI0013D21052|nr:flagellar export protein FliJ [Clostridium thermarum]
MQGFRFPLQKLLDIRVDKEEQSKRKLMEAQRQQNITQAKLDELKANYAKYNVLDNKLTVAEKKMKVNYLNALANGILKTKDELEQKKAVVNSCREDVRLRQIERKTVEIIKDKRLEAFKKEQDRKEQVQIDEFALYAYMRNLERG